MGSQDVRLEIRPVLPEDYPGILQIQADNYVGNLSPSERLGGFMSAEYTTQQIAEMAIDPGVLVAREGSRVLGFLFTSSLGFSPQPPLVARMVQEFDHVDYQGRLLNSYRCFLYGPVCIDRSQRGRGLLRRLFGALLESVSGKYEVGIAFVSEENPHSFRVHVDGLGMSAVGHFEFEGKGHHILAFSVTGS